MRLQEELLGVPLCLETEKTLFSPSGVDCGCGVVGVWLCKKGCRAELCDVDPLAVETARRNLILNGIQAPVYLSDGLSDVHGGPYTLILSNPPYHADFSVARRFIEDGFRRLQEGGRLCLVVKRLPWYRNKMRSVFGGVRVQEKDGYFILLSEKRTEKPFPKREKPKETGMSKKLRRRQALKHQNNGR